MKNEPEKFYPTLTILVTMHRQSIAPLGKKKASPLPCQAVLSIQRSIGKA